MREQTAENDTPDPEPERTKVPGECPGCHAMPFGRHAPDCPVALRDRHSAR